MIFMVGFLVGGVAILITMSLLCMAHDTHLRIGGGKGRYIEGLVTWRE